MRIVRKINDIKMKLGKLQRQHCNWYWPTYFLLTRFFVVAVLLLVFAGSRIPFVDKTATCIRHKAHNSKLYGERRKSIPTNRIQHRPLISFISLPMQLRFFIEWIRVTRHISSWNNCAFRNRSEINYLIITWPNGVIESFISNSNRCWQMCICNWENSENE